MNRTQESIIIDPDFELVPREEIPTPPVYRNKKTGNHVFFVDGKVMDRYFVTRDRKGKDGKRYLECGIRKTGLGAQARNIFEGVASAVLFFSSPKFRVATSVLGLDYEKIRRAIERLGNLIDKEKVRQAVPIFLGEEAENVRAYFRELVRDGELSEEDWRKIQELAEQAHEDDETDTQ